MRISVLATTVTVAAAALCFSPAASAQSLSSLINDGTIDALSSGVSSGENPRLVIAKRIADKRFASLDCSDIVGSNTAFKKFLSANLDYSDADKLAAAAIEAGLFDEQIDKAGLTGSDREEFATYLRHVMVEKAVTCGVVSDPKGKAAAFRSAQDAEDSGSSSLSSGLSS